MLEMQHNVVGILYTIKGIVETQLDRSAENSIEDPLETICRFRRILRRIYVQAERALRIARRVSEVLKTENARAGGISHVSLETVWQEAAALLRKKFSMESVEILERIPEGFPPVRCHPSDLRDILYQIARNAVEAILEPGGASNQEAEKTRSLFSAGVLDGGEDGTPAEKKAGKLIIRAHLQFSVEEDPLAVITLSDTGPGIPEKILARLFEPFFTTKNLEEGNGLGLCLVRGLVRRNQGKISVSSFQGSGTTFTLCFPAAKIFEPEVRDSSVITH
jgi:signal transduction histidine kinase